MIMEDIAEYTSLSQVYSTRNTKSIFIQFGQILASYLHHIIVFSLGKTDNIFLTGLVCSSLVRKLCGEKCRLGRWHSSTTDVGLLG